MKTRKGSPGKNQGRKAYHYVPLDHLAIRPHYRLSSSNDTNQSNQLSAKQQSDETLKDIGAIEELELNGIVTHSYFPFTQNCMTSVFTEAFSYQSVSLLVQKRLLQANFKKINTKSFSQEIMSFFPFLFCFARTSNDLFLTYAFEYDCCS